MNNNQQENNILRIPVEPVPLSCDECQGENFPNYRYELVGIKGVLCKPCLNKELAAINIVLNNQQENKGYNDDFLEAIKPED